MMTKVSPLRKARKYRRKLASLEAGSILSGRMPRSLDNQLWTSARRASFSGMREYCISTRGEGRVNYNAAPHAEMAPTSHHNNLTGRHSGRVPGSRTFAVPFPDAAAPGPVAQPAAV